MPSTTAFEYGEVVLVNFPFTDLGTTKRRPAVVISRRSYNSIKPDLILMALTSRSMHAPEPGDVLIQDLQAAGLPRPSRLKPVVATVEQAIVRRVLGRLSSDDQMRLNQLIQQILGPDSASA